MPSANIFCALRNMHNEPCQGWPPPCGGVEAFALCVADRMNIVPETIIFSVYHNGMGAHYSFESLLGFYLDLLQLGKLHLQIGNLINAETFCGFNDLFFIHINSSMDSTADLIFWRSSGLLHFALISAIIFSAILGSM